MIVHTLSPSKMERLRLCEARVEAQLTDSEYEEEQGEPARTGILAHEAAKLWYRKDDAGNPLYADADLCFKAAIESCAKKVVKRSSGDITISELPHEASSLQEARTMFDTIVAHYKREVLKVVFVEQRYKGSLKNGVPIHLIIDLAVDRGNGVLEIIDYKTGFLACTTSDMWDKDQVLMNLLAVSCDPTYQQYPTKQFTYYWVKKAFETGPISLSMERLSDYEHWLSTEYIRILAIEQPSESLNRFCSSCGRRFDCTKYREFMSEALDLKAVPTPVEMAAMDDDDIMGRHDRLKGQIKLLEDFREALTDRLKEVLKQRQTTELEGKTFKADLRSSKHNSMSAATVLALCQSKGKDPAICFSVKQKEVEAIFSTDPEAMGQLNLTMKRGQTQPSLAVTQIGVKKARAPRKPKETAAAMPDLPIQPAPGSEAIHTEQPPL